MIEGELSNPQEEKKDRILDLKEKLRPYICPYEEILKEIGEGQSVLDVGCGQGGLLQLCARELNPTKLGGIEIKEELILRAQRNLENSGVQVSLHVFDGKTIPDEISEYDVVTMIDVLHHIPPKQQLPFLEQLVEKMKPGAKLVLKDIDGNSPWVVMNKMHDLLISGNISHEPIPDELEAY